MIFFILLLLKWDEKIKCCGIQYSYTYQIAEEEIKPGGNRIDAVELHRISEEIKQITAKAQTGGDFLM